MTPPPNLPPSPPPYPSVDVVYDEVKAITDSVLDGAEPSTHALASSLGPRASLSGRLPAS
jgi:hypothetical protein